MGKSSKTSKSHTFVLTSILFAAGLVSACGETRSSSDDTQGSAESSVNSAQSTNAADQANARSFTQANQRKACESQANTQWVDSAMESDPEKRRAKDDAYNRTINDCTNIDIRTIDRIDFGGGGGGGGGGR
jgi:hypothetical protein